MDRKDFWFRLQADFSPDPETGNYSSGSARSFHLLQASPDTLGTDLSQYPLTSPPESGRELSQHTIRNMDSTVNNETTSTNDTQEISSSQQESDGHLGDDANSTSSFQDSHQDEAVHSAIMEVSGELMLGRFSTHKHGSGGSESSDLSDDDHHRLGSGGVIAKYPESSTGLSDNDWNPYATESDTNQTPRSPRSNSDDQSQVGFVSKASLNIGGSAKPKESVATVSMTTGEVNVRDRKNGNEDSTSNANASEKLDILRYVVDGENDARRSPEAQSEYTDRTVSARQSMESGSYRSEQSGTLSGRPSSEFDQDNYRRESGESAQSYGSGTRSGRESGESQGPSGRSSRSDQEAGRQSVESQKSGRSEFSQSSGQSQPSQKSSARSAGSDRSERLDRLEETAGDNIKELIQFESAQRGTSSGEDTKKEESSDVAQRKQREDTSPVSRTRLTARLEPYAGPVRSSKSPEISSSAARSEDRYICVAERERLLSDSPEYSKLLPKHMSQDRKEDSEGKRRYNAEEKLERDPPKYSSSIVPRSIETIATRSPSQVSMRRVSDLFEETKRQSREAIQFQRPEPSGSEERFPLRERMALSKHDESFKMQDKSGASEGKLEKSRDSENARSLNSEEVARVLGKYADDETSEPMRKKEPKPKGDAILVSAFERLEQPAEIGASGAVDYTGVRLSDPHRGDESDDEIARRVRAILSQTDHLGGMKGYTARNPGEVDYVPRTIDYSLLQRDLQEIQDSLHDVPQPAANDSMHLLKARRDGAAEGIGENPREDTRMSLENTATTSGGRESGVSEYGRRLIWDHGADLQYDQGFGGEFMGTMATGDTLSSRMRGSGDTDSLTVTVRPDSAATNDTENDMTDFEGTRTLTGDDMSRAEKIVQQVMSRRAEGDLKESVEDIIARYRNERQDLFDRFQPTEPTVSRQSEPKQIDEVERREEKKSTPALANPDFALPNVNPAGDASGPVNGKKQPGLAERVYKILSADPDKDESDSSQDKSMAKKVYKILASDRPKEQVNGILTETLEVEHEMLKKMVSRPKDDSSLDDSGLNETADSFAPDDDNVRKQLEYSQFSSPGKGDKSEFTALREVTSAPYSALSNAKSLLSTQLKKMSERNFDKSVELRTPYRQTVECYPVYGMERQLTESGGQDMEDVREAWMPSRRSAGSRSTAPTGGRDRALDSERFYVTDRDREPVTHQRTYSDPFDTSPSRRSALRDGHTRSRSEEAVGISDISQYSTADQRPFIDDHCTPQQHRPQGYRGDGSPSPTESDTSGSRKPGAKIRPYRPAGSRDMYYTESGDETNESATTLESTHPASSSTSEGGSDDAAPPYIPAHFLGSRRDDPPKHPTGIYSNKDKDILSTIDEQSVKDDKEKALSSSTGSGKGRLPASGGDAEDRRSNPDLAGSRHSEDKRSTVTSDTGYHSNPNLRSHSPFSQREAAGLDSGDRDLNRRNQGNGKGINPSGSENTISERPGFKTREEFQRDFERRERELKEVLARSRRPHTSVPLERDSLGASTRSDPGGALEEANPRWEYRESDQMGEFRPLEPEPAYPQDRVRHSRSRSDTDLVALSPTESQKYSSPMQPGTRFLELSTQPSPIFSHQDSLTREHRGRAEELPRVPPSREFPQSPPAQELPNVPDRRPATPPREYPVRPLEPGERSRPQEGQRSTVLDNPMGPVDIGADPRRLGTMRRPTGDGGNSGDRKEKRAKSPLDVRQKEMEAELEKLNRQLADQVADIKVGRPEEEYFEDNFPPSKKAQVLREVLEQEYQDGLPANINDMWSRFKEHREQSVTESSLNSTRLDTLSGLLHNPTQHAVHSFIKEKSVENVKQKQAEIEQLEREHEEKLRMRIEEKRVAEERASRERTQRRQELRAKSGSGISEEESNGSYSEILMEEERRRERLKRREEREGKRNKSPNKRSPRDGKVEAKTESLRKDRKAGKEGQEGKTKEQGIVTDIRARKNVNKHSESTDTLFSIPEDASFEQSPTKAESEMKARQKRHRHIIDPLMMKLRDKIKMQRDKIDKERRKELQRVQKLKKLELLLNAKKKGKLSDKAIGVELEDVSSTSCVSHSDGSHLSDSMLTAHLSTSNESDASSQSSTLIDSTIDSNIKLQVKKYPETEFRSPKKKYVESDSTETSDFSNIVVERITEKKGGKKKDKKSKEKKYKVDEFGRKIKKEKREKKQKAVFGVELSEKDIINQLQRYEQYMTPERKRRSRDASTMYPSPITVSPPSRRRMREVLMKSEAIQTSPSIRSTSPTHAYDEVPVAPVPYMSRQSGKTQRRRPSPSPNRSTQTSTSPVGRRSSRSPTTSANRKSSRSPVTFALRPTSKSPTSQRRRFIPPITRKQAQSPIWKPERELTTPPMNSMFTPEGDENADPARCSKQESATWFIPMKPGQPWRQPLKERQALAVRQEAWQPKSVSQSTWKDIVHGDVLKDHGDPNDISRDTKFDLDPEGNPIGEGSDSEESEVDIGMEKPLTKMSLQEAFEARKRATISRLRERQKRVTLAAEQRKMEDYLRLERDRLFNEERKKEANPEAHPYSGHLHRPARRIISKEEMKEMTEKKYKKLPEVVKAKQMKKVQDEYNLNRIKARLFNRRIQKRVLQKADKWGS
ncbi:uncharacterized protein LOC128211403 isoform X5 [Mya arenaria]|uniref:uncharacterized protein LOC128211403 isoform X5 n=1 Tax=Mya arenaria TaxID=6604 RepID=UPI0022DFFCE5|nr:uncharacterized protein LOC128211403 isoform X5 [Mya arenaria]